MQDQSHGKPSILQAHENGQADSLRRDVYHLAADIGPRNIYHYNALQRAADHIATSLRDAGYTPLLHSYKTEDKTFANISAELPGREHKDEIIVIGAHYDTHKDSPGANDNGSAIAALLELARHFVRRPMGRTLRFVAFTNEESPFTRRKAMGSRVYAGECRRRRDNIIGMICLETIGCYSQEIGSQWLSFGGLFLPRRGDFLALVANPASKHLLRQVSATIAHNTALRIRPVILPTFCPGAWSSDHWSFWREGFPALMATDTAPLRYRYYHTRADTPDKINFGWLSQIVSGFRAVIADVATPR